MAACGYKISKLKGLLVTEPGYVSVEEYSAYVSRAVRLDVMNIEFSGESELNDVYAFGKKLTVEVRFLSIPELSGKRLILEDVAGKFYLIEEEFDSSVTWRFNLDKTTESTTWDIEIPSNIQILPCTVTTVTPTSASCEYNSTYEPELTVAPKPTSLLDMRNGMLLSDDSVSLEGTVTYTLSYDGVKYESRAQVSMPLTGANVEMSDSLQRFMLYRHMTVVKSQNGWYVSGFEHGADCKVDIVAQTTDAKGTITLTFTETSDTPCLFADEFSVVSGESLFYDYVKYAHDGSEGFVCYGDGVAMYVLQRGFYQDGTATETYKVKNGYASMFPDLNVVGTFYTNKTFPNLECTITDSLSTTFPSSNVLTGSGKTKTGSVTSERSSWLVQSKPSFVTVSPNNGSAGSTNVTITATSSTPASGSIIFRNDTMTQVIQVTINPGNVTADPSTHDATSFTVKLRPVSQSNVPTLESSPSGITTTKYSGWKWKASIPVNNTTSDRTFTWVFSFSGITQYVTVTQSGCFEQWKPTGGYICDDGDSYVKEVRLISYYGSSWTPTGEWRKGDLLEADAPYCTV